MAGKWMQSISRFFRLLYLKLFRINDTPQRVSLGFGLGVFLGVLPGAGPVAALLLAFVFRLNRAAAVLGSLVTNTWISVATFALAVKAGSALFGLDWHAVRSSWLAVIKDFHFARLLELRRAAIAVMIGYIVVSLAIGAAAYLAALIAIMRGRGRKRKIA
jgi:uncharacterized protein (DUF2062 family)